MLLAVARPTNQRSSVCLRTGAAQSSNGVLFLHVFKEESTHFNALLLFFENHLCPEARQNGQTSTVAEEELFRAMPHLALLRKSSPC